MMRSKKWHAQAPASGGWLVLALLPLLGALVAGCVPLAGPNAVVAPPSNAVGAPPRAGGHSAPIGTPPPAGQAQSSQGSAQQSQPSAPTDRQSPAALPFNIIIADRGNNRIIEVTPDKRIVWTYHFEGLRPGLGADDAFFTPGNRTIIANLEEGQTIVEIDYATRKIIWQYGIPGRRGAGPNQLNEPDDAYRLPDGTTTVADIKNCRVLFIDARKRIVKQYGHTLRCGSAPGFLNKPNGDTPLPNGHTLITEIRGSRVSEVDASGAAVWSFRAPVSYPSDAQITARGTIILADYSDPGAILELATNGAVLWEYRFPKGSAQALDRPSLAAELPNGNIIANDDFNHRVIVIDKATRQIIWQYGVTGHSGSGAGELSIPDGLDWRH